MGETRGQARTQRRHPSADAEPADSRAVEVGAVDAADPDVQTTPHDLGADDLEGAAGSVRHDPTVGGAVATGGNLLRRAHDLLLKRNEPLTAEELARHIFASGPLPPGTGASWVYLVEQLLAPAPMFARDEEGRWGLAAWILAERDLDDVEFIVLDVETTGLAPGRHRLIEVGAVLLRGGEVAASFQSLVNPGRSIP